MWGGGLTPATPRAGSLHAATLPSELQWSELGNGRINENVPGSLCESYVSHWDICVTYG